MKIKMICILAAFAWMSVGCGKKVESPSIEISEEHMEQEKQTEPEESMETEKAEESEEEELQEPEALQKIYADYFTIGMALNPHTIGDSYKNIVLENFSSITCENEMKPDYILEYEGSQKGVEDDAAFVAVSFDACADEIKYCQENGLKMRFHTLVWHSQTPEWFFHEDYDLEKELADKELMKERMKNYIYGVIDYFDKEYPDLIYTIDVVNEAFNGNGEYKIKEDENLWYDTIGYDYLYYAFVYAKDALESSEHMKDVTLVYNDYNMMYKVHVVSEGLDAIFKEHDSSVYNYVDAIGFQGHLDTQTSMSKFAEAVKAFCDLGYEVQITELDIGIPNIAVGEKPDEKALEKQGKKIRSLMERMMALVDTGCRITSVSVWGISDNNSWRKDADGKDAHALLWDSNLQEKQALRGMALCDDVLSYYTYELPD